MFIHGRKIEFKYSPKKYVINVKITFRYIMSVYPKRNNMMFSYIIKYFYIILYIIKLKSELYLEHLERCNVHSTNRLDETCWCKRLQNYSNMCHVNLARSSAEKIQARTSYSSWYTHYDSPRYTERHGYAYGSSSQFKNRSPASFAWSFPPILFESSVNFASSWILPFSRCGEIHFSIFFFF